MGGPLQQSASAGPHISSHGADTGDAVMARWLQSAGLQHLAAPLAAAALDHRLLPSLLMQDYARYGVQSLEDKQKLFRLIKTISSGAEPSSEPTTPPPYSRPANRSGMDFLSPEFRGDFGAGILDLHSIDDSELFSEVSIPEPFHSSPSFVPVIEKGFENDFESSFNIGKSQNKAKFNAESSPLRSNTLERERGAGRDNTVARIKVVVRKRPINKKELARKEDDIVTIEDNSTVTVHEPKLKVDLTAYVEKHEFVFDAVLDESVSNDEVYNVTVEPIVPAIFQRTKATCFAYGQTGSGKTYTMQPLPLRASQDILGLMQQSSYKYEGFQLWLSFFEIYGGKLYDLLNERRKLCMREDGRQQVCIVGLKEYRVSDVQLVKEYIDKGNASRSTGSTGANEESSRSHAILQLVIKKSPDGSDAKAAARPQGKLSFIDLAGSERGADTTDNDRQTRMEGAEINKSLLALKECIRALDNDQGHIPFRGSKLTEVLRDSFVGDSRTVMISCISPNAGSCEHTLNTLRYADRVKGLSKSGSSKRETTTVTAPTAQRETNNSPPPAPTVQPPPQQVQEFQQESRGSERFMWQNQMAEREGLSVGEYTYSGREESRMNSSFSGREERGMNSNFQGREDRGMNSGFSGREESRLPSGFQGREENRMPSNFQGREENRIPSFQGREESRNTSFQGREENRIPSYQGREENRIPTFQGRDQDSRMNSGFQGREQDSRMTSGFQGREQEGRMNSNFQGREQENRMNSSFQGREQESRMSSGFQGREQESRMTSGYQGRDQESRMNSGFPSREQEGRMNSGFPGREQESRITSGFSGRDESRMTSVASEKDRMNFRDNMDSGIGNLRDMSAPGGNDSLEQERHQLVLPSRRKGTREDKSDRNSVQVKEELSRADSMNGYQRRSNPKDELSMNASQYAMKETDSELESIQTGYDGHINAILEEEEEVISAHRKEVEDTMEIVREEMKLLAEVDRPGSRIDRYVSQLNYVLSRKAAGIVNLQARLTRFQRHLKEQEILSRTTGLRQP
ncbi:kinesin family member 2/24 [Marchantia polymorpha subsp. ruderalis]|uniref:Kinesin motor domain-containing protein n=4 Tax=Marchantia polymorpha TaxID=3197 RepID=A0AAF6ATM3_MARPO|nr:hypothetical protein MARPO_0061s0132 [Marchantia polymorpha]BBM99793.1 hypothetical protein Mp_1g23880 [Marchantia polymorpha subsp. ruderalis]|eukprot:PTQ36891.1 hypothetical protein MARPO_0061s0132 [Marchantia polymorpha]